MVNSVLSYSGGIGTTATLLLTKDKIKEAVFIDHGSDFPETYEYIDMINDSIFPIKRVKPHVTIKKDNITFDNLYDYLYYRKCVPMPYPLPRYCSVNFKKHPFDRYMKKNHPKGTQVYLGYTYEEKHRTKYNKNKKYPYAYPLIDYGITRKQAKHIIKDHGLPIPRKSSCWFCFALTKSEILELKFKHPNLYIKLKKLYLNSNYNHLKYGLKEFSFFDNQTYLKSYIVNKMNKSSLSKS